MSRISQRQKFEGDCTRRSYKACYEACRSERLRINLDHAGTTTTSLLTSSRVVGVRAAKCRGPISLTFSSFLLVAAGDLTITSVYSLPRHGEYSTVVATGFVAVQL